MAATQIKNGFHGGSDDQLLVNPDGSINVNTTGSGTAANVNIHDGVGNVITSTAGALNVHINGGTGKLVYAEITNVPIGVETAIVSYTVLVTSAVLQLVNASGSNIGEVRIYKNGVAIDKNYLYYTQYNTFLSFGSGLALVQTDIIEVRGLNSGLDVCKFNARIQIIEGS